ncbi:MAG: hypothetical protein RL518_1512 [Pseudomonadota bacterium]|jgi:ribosomal protein S18 acetylase RimI-like enzyme
MNLACPAVTVSTLSDDQVPLYKELRLRALRDHPDAFMESPEAFEARPVEAIAQRIRESQAVGGFTLVAQHAEAGFIGTASVAVGVTPKDAHRGLVWGVYVAPEVRGLGVGLLLLKELISRASSCGKLRNLSLSVVSSNQPALQLYQSLGFKEYGFDKDALYVNGEFLSEVLMSMDLPKNLRS